MNPATTPSADAERPGADLAPATARTPARRGGPVERLRLDEVWRGLQAFARREGAARGKRVELVATGGELDVGRPAAQALRGALAALVRNAVDHGVESPAARMGAGKPAIAVLRLAARRLGGSIEIVVADDGRGVDPARMRERLVAEGRLSRSEAESLGAVDAQRLIFDPGAKPSLVPAAPAQAAGLEGVREALHAAGGRVSLASSPGRGAAFTLTVPADPDALRRVRSAA